MLKKLTSIICATAVLAGMSSNVLAGTGTVPKIENRVIQNVEYAATPADFQEIQDKLQPYISTSDDGDVTFDINAAIAAGEDEMIIEIGQQMNRFSRQMQADPNEAARNARLSFPIWGNWCGPGHSGPQAPVDILDAQCKKHDLCYDRKGYFSCSCDRELERNINNNWSSMKSEEKIVAAAVYTFFSNFPCNPFA